MRAEFGQDKESQTICLVFRNFNISIVLYLLLSIVSSAIIYISVQLVIRNPVYYDLFKKNMRIK